MTHVALKLPMMWLKWFGKLLGNYQSIWHNEKVVIIIFKRPHSVDNV